MKTLCSHCHLEFDSEVMIKDGDHYFCCKGCQGIYHLLNSEGLDSFYNKLGENHLSPPKEKMIDSSIFDTDSFFERYVKKEGELCKVSLILEGIHCAACVWLNEKILHKSAGVIKADINYTNNKANITFDPTKIKLSEIIEKIRSIGYDAHAYDPKTQEELANKTKREYYTKMVVGIFCTMNIMWIAVAQYAGYFTGMHPEIKTILNITELILATPALFYSGSIFFRGGYYGLKSRYINMDLLVASGATLVYFYSIYATFWGDKTTYFESATMIVTFVLIGKFLETRGKKSAADILDTLNSQIPSEVTVMVDGSRVAKKPQEVEIGAIIELKNGEKAALDGVLISDRGQFDESSLSGESHPVTKAKEGTVYSGTINIGENVLYKTTKRFEDSILSNILNLVEESISKKPEIEIWANELSKNFSLTILGIALATFFGWYIFGEAGFERSMIISIAVIIIACPCALALATPVATLIGIGESMKSNILFKESRFLETIAKADVLVIDKTGTITEGKPKVVQHKFYTEGFESYIYSLAKSSNHPISKGIVTFLEGQFEELRELPLEQIRSFEAKGVTARYNDQMLLGGNPALLEQYGITLKKKDSLSSLYLFALDKELIAIFELSDEPKEGAKEVLGKLKDMGLEIVMLTGDREEVAQEIAKKVGIEHLCSQMHPMDKALYIDELHKNGKIVVMAGDGINDALALSKSDIAISMGKGADVSIAVSDVVVLDDSLKGLLYAFVIGKNTYKKIKQNLAISLVYNALSIPLAVMGYIIPLIAALSMSLSSLLVVGNSIRMGRNLQPPTK